MFSFFLLQLAEANDIQKATILHAHLSNSGDLKCAVDLAMEKHPQDSGWFTPLVREITQHANNVKSEFDGYNALDDYLFDMFDRLCPLYFIDGVFKPELSNFTADELAMPHLRWLTVLHERVQQCAAFDDADPYFLAQVHPNMGIADTDAIELLRIYTHHYIRVMDLPTYLMKYKQQKEQFLQPDGQHLNANADAEFKHIVEKLGEGKVTFAIDWFCRRHRLMRFVFRPILEKIVSTMN